jgi:hypothetical protein
MTRRFAAASLAAALAVSGCASKSASHEDTRNAPASAPAPAATGQAAITADTKPVNDGRKVIRTGRIDLLVASYDEARAKLDALVAANGGYVDATDVNRRAGQASDATIVVRLPKDSFSSVIPKLREIGEVLSESTNANDVTDEYVDVSARLASARTLEKRLLELASDKTGNIDQVLSVERELARVRGEIEGYEGHLRAWNDLIAMSTLTLSVQTKRPEIVAAPAHVPTLGERTSRAFGSSLDALREVASAIVVDAIAFLPWLLLAVPGLVLARKFLRRFRRRVPEARVVP